MSREYDVLAALRDYLPDHMDAAPETNLTANQIVIAYPDSDKMRYPVMLYIVPEGGAWETLTTSSLLERMTLTVYILLRNSETHREQADMVEALLEYFAAFTNALHLDPTLEGVIDDAKINSYDFYPFSQDLTSVFGLEINLEATIS